MGEFGFDASGGAPPDAVGAVVAWLSPIRGRRAQRSQHRGSGRLPGARSATRMARLITSRYVSNGDARLHYLDSGGDDHGAPIVFVPGMTTSPTTTRKSCRYSAAGWWCRGTGSRTEQFAGEGIRPRQAEPRRRRRHRRGDRRARSHRDVLKGNVVRGGMGDRASRTRPVISIGDYVPEERVVTHAASLHLLEGRWRGTPVHERLDVDAAMQTFHAAQSRSMWEPLSRLQPALLVVRSGNSVLVNDADWARYRELFPGVQLVDSDDSPHDIFRPDRERYPRLVRDHDDRVDRQRPTERSIRP